ncbi:MAG TPA: DUF2309 domain-containing protein [Cyclobacteriaceae bacterium]|nr:DUF2309 domain-containing protein [Cyclobacteriaceae bacterium]
MKSNHVAIDEAIRNNGQTGTPLAGFDEAQVLHDLKHYLPEQAALKDFIHQNTLQAFQKMKFYDGLRHASQILGHKVSFSIEEYRALYKQGKINEMVLDRVVRERKGDALAAKWKKMALEGSFDALLLPRIGSLRSNWKRQYKVDLDSQTHPILFRVLCSYLDQGISIWTFPIRDMGFLESVKEMEQNSFTSFFRGKRAKKLLLENNCGIADLLRIVVGDETLYQQYLFDQQFAHQGWSGIVSIIETMPQTLLDTRKISIHDLVVFELLLEIDALDANLGKEWLPLCFMIKSRPVELFAEVPKTDYHDIMIIWQDAFEWTYYDQVLEGIREVRIHETPKGQASFQAMFCIDDRETSLRRYLEKIDPMADTYATPGFFSSEFFFQPEGGKFYTKVCPAPMNPKYLIKEYETKEKRETDFHFSKHSHSFYGGWLISQTIGFWSALKLALNIFRPTISPATALSFRHMENSSQLTIENTSPDQVENGLQIGFTIDEMAARVEGLLMSIGLVDNFAPIVYVVGHGASSVNNPHFAAYDCGACSGRPGSVNARVFCYMANHTTVRKMLAEKGINIPATTRFVGGLHDTTRDEIDFYDVNALSPDNRQKHLYNLITFDNALDLNSKERSRRFESIDSRGTPKHIHEEVRRRSVSLFEPRPELNHAANALCIVGRRSLTRELFMDRRAFMNSYDYRIDPTGKYLLNILRPAAPVCGGINLEYFFSRVDNNKLGAGTKLPHNVMGLFGVANGIDGDLRPGLPSQMIEVHDPIRLLIIVEQFPDLLLETIQRSPETYEWFINEWVHLIAVEPETRVLHYFKEGKFIPYQTLTKKIDVLDDINRVVEEGNSIDYLPVYKLS